MRNLNEANETANYKNDVNAKHNDHKQIFKTPIYVIKNATNDIFKLATAHVEICESIMLKKPLQKTFIDNVRRSKNGETNLYYIRQLLAKIDKLGFDNAILAIQKKAAKKAEDVETAKYADASIKMSKKAA